MMRTIGWCLCGLLYFCLCTAHARAPMGPVSAQPIAEDFTLETLDGTSVALGDYRDKFVLLNFWATWCAPCRKEMPALDNLHKELNHAGLEVVGVHVGPSLDSIKKFLNQVPVEFTILVDLNMELSNWGVLGLPTTFLVSPEGRIIYRAVGEREWDSAEVVRFITKVMSGNPPVVEADGTHSGASSFLEYLKASLGLNLRGDKERELLSD